MDSFLLEGKSPNIIKKVLIKEGYAETDIINAIQTSNVENYKNTEEEKINKKILIKDFIDKIGYGFSSNQFVNILFFQTGASYFLIAIITMLRTVLGTLFSTFLHSYSKNNEISNQTIGYFGVIFGFSFIFMAIARFFHSVELFSIAILIGTLGIIAHGDYYKEVSNKLFKDNKNIRIYGLLISAISIILTAFFLDTFPATGTNVIFLGLNFKLYGYLIAFEITAFAFILSSYIITFIPERKIKLKENIEFSANVKAFFIKTKSHIKLFLKNKTLLILFVGSSIVGLAQTFLNSYYGIFIYRYFEFLGFKGFMNVGIIFVVALITALITPYITKTFAKTYGNLPLLIFGTILSAILPLTYYYNPNLIAISMATIASIIGGAISGLATGFIISEIIPENNRNTFFASFAILVLIPYLILLPIMGYYATKIGLSILFLICGILILLVIPIFLILHFIKKERILLF